MGYMTKSWMIRHFSQANQKGPGQGDVPALLRRVADSIEGSAQDAGALLTSNEETPSLDLDTARVQAHKRGRPAAGEPLCRPAKCRP